MHYSAASNRIFIFGGRDGDTLYNDAWALDLATTTWRELGAGSAEQPPARFGTVLMVSEPTQTMYVATGQGAGGIFLNDVWALDLASDSWTDLSASAGTPPAARFGSAGGYLGDSMILTHGCGDAAYTDTWFFDTSSGQWLPFEPGGGTPAARCLATATLGGPDLTIHGGCFSGEDDCTIDDTWIMETNSTGWLAIPGEIGSTGEQHQTLVSADNNGYLLLYGGETADGAASGELWMLDWATIEWSPFGAENNPAPRFDHTAAWLPDTGMLIFGGRNNEGALCDLQLLLVDPSNVQPGLMSESAPAEEPAPEDQPAEEATPVPAEPTATPELISPPTGSEHDGS
jgi:hypothetical protein